MKQVKLPKEWKKFPFARYALFLLAAWLVLRIISLLFVPLAVYLEFVIKLLFFAAAAMIILSFLQ